MSRAWQCTFAIAPPPALLSYAFKDVLHSASETIRKLAARIDVILSLPHHSQPIGQRLGLPRRLRVVVIGIAPLDDIVVLPPVDADLVIPAAPRQQTAILDTPLADWRAPQLAHHLPPLAIATFPVTPPHPRSGYTTTHTQTDTATPRS